MYDAKAAYESQSKSSASVAGKSKRSTKSAADTFRGLLFLAAIGLCGAWVWSVASPMTWDQFRYSIEYETDQSNVYVEPKPHDCDFNKAPLGDKECHFEKVVTTGTANGKISVYVTWEKVQE
jgi:hypothetical protein